MIKRALTTIFILAAITLWAQQPTDPRVNETFRKTPLPKALKIIQKNCDVKFAYDHALIQNIIVSLDLKDLNITQSLERLLKGTSLTFAPVGGNYVIIPKPPGEKESIVERTTINLTGSVIDADNGETLPQATIRVKNTNIATASNNDGYFSLFNVPGDTCTLEVMYLGYITRTVPLKNSEKLDQFTIKLKSDTRVLNEVVVLGEYNHAVHVEDIPGALVFNPMSVANLPSLGEQDISRTLQLLPGISATDESSSGTIIRGGHPSFNLTVLDGMTIYQQDHFFGAFSIINSDVIKDVHVYKGMFDAKFGGRTSGVVDITTKNGNAVRPSFNVKVNLMNLKASVEIPIGKKWSFFAAGRRSFTDVIQTKLFTTLFDIASISNDQIRIFNFDNPNRPITSEYYFYDANSKLTYRPTERDVISLSVYTGRDRMHIRDSIAFVDGNDKYFDKTDEKTRWGNNGMSLRWARQWNDQYYSNFRISSSRFFRLAQWNRRFELDEITSAYWFDIDNSIGDVSYALDNEWSLHTNLSIAFGLAGTRQTYDVHIKDRFVLSGMPDEEFPEDTDVKESAQTWLNSLYASATLSPIKRLTTIVGARLVNYNNMNSQLYIEPRVSASYKLSEALNLKAGYGRNNQFLTQQFWYSEVGSLSGVNENFWTLSDPGSLLNPVISSDHVTAGATVRSKRFVYDAEVYYKQTRHVMLDENFNSGTNGAYGIDFMVQKTSGIHTGWIAYSLGQVIQTHPYLFNEQSVPSLQDQRHEIKVVDMLTLGNWNLSATALYGSGKPFRSYSIRYFYDENGLITDYTTTYDYRNKARLPAYFRIDLAASYKFHFKQSRELEIGLSLHNVTDHKNVKARRLDRSSLDEAVFTNTERDPVYIDIVLMGISPSFFVSCSF